RSNICISSFLSDRHATGELTGKRHQSGAARKMIVAELRKMPPQRHLGFIGESAAHVRVRVPFGPDYFDRRSPIGFQLKLGLDTAGGHAIVTRKSITKYAFERIGGAYIFGNPESHGLAVRILEREPIGIEFCFGRSRPGPLV